MEEDQIGPPPDRRENPSPQAAVYQLPEPLDEDTRGQSPDPLVQAIGVGGGIFALESPLYGLPELFRPYLEIPRPVDVRTGRVGSRLPAFRGGEYLI